MKTVENEPSRAIQAPLERIVDAAAKPCVPFVPECITPNHITWFNLLIGLIGGVLIYLSTFWPSLLWAAAVLILLHAFLDSLDGATARGRNQTSHCGKMLDHLFDSFAFCAYSFGLAFSPYANFSIAVVIAILIVYHDFLLMMWLALTGRWQTGVFSATELQFAFAFFCIATWFHPDSFFQWNDMDFHLFDLAVMILGPCSIFDFYVSSRKLYLHLKELD